MNKTNQTVHISNKAADSVEKRVRAAIDWLGGMRQWVSPGKRIVIKPNFVAPFREAVTDFDVIRAVVKEIKSVGGTPLIAESSGYEFNTEQTFQLLEVYDLATELDVEVLNLDNEPYRKIPVENGLIKNYSISEIAFTADAIINLPRLKKHSQTDITCGMKNLFGLLSRRTRAKIHSVNLDRGIVELNRIISPVLTIVDASTVLERAVYGKAIQNRRSQIDGVIAGTDTLIVDRFCCKLLGIEPDSIDHISIASKKRTSCQGLGSMGYTEENYTDVARLRHTTKEKMHRLAYRLIFTLETILSHLVGESSIVSYFHYYLGIRPKINASLCDRCGDCAEVCPIDVIDLKRKKILRDCMQLRCLRCYEECNLNAIELVGRKSLRSPVKDTGGRRFKSARPGQ